MPYSFEGNNPPFYYDYINANSWKGQPNTVHVADTLLQRYFEKYLLQQAISAFKFKLPEEWPMNYFLYILYCRGYIGVIETDKFGVIPQFCTLSGYNIYYQPSHIVISNPLIKYNEKPRIGKNCTLIQLMPDYSGIMDIVGYFASQLAMITETGNINVFNSKLSYVFFAGSKAAGETYKKAYDELAKGSPMTVIDKSTGHTPDKPAWTMFQQNVGQNYIYNEVLESYEKVKNIFLTEIGIPNSNTEKKERVNELEVISNNVEVSSKANVWLETIKKGMKETNKMFGTNLSVEWRIDPTMKNKKEDEQFKEKETMKETK